MKIEIFSKDFCPACDKAIHKAQAMIQETTNTVEVFKLGRDFTREELMEQFPTARTFPQIIFMGEKIGGYNELKAQFD